MAQEIITAFPNPKDAALAVAAHLDAVARLNHKAGVTLDMAHEISNLEALLTVIYGDRFAEFKVVEQERMQAEQQQQQEQAQQQAEAARRAQLEQDVTFDGRELLLTKHRRSLDRTKSRVVARNLRDVRPVSYTHLDVYKRQSLVCTSSTLPSARRTRVFMARV